MTKLGELIDGIEVAMLTTHTADGSMVSRPLQTLEFDGGAELVFFTSAKSQKVERLREHPDANLAYANPSKQTYVSVRGTARLDHNRATIDKLWSAPCKIYFPKGKDDPDIGVLRIKVRDAVYWDAAGNFATRSLNFVKAVASGDPHDLGETGKLSGTA